MSDYKFNPHFGDGIPVKADRIFDSCSDKDCFSNLSVKLIDGMLPPNINILRSRSAEVENVCVSVEPVPFNRGFYQIDLTFTFTVEILGYEKTCTAPEMFRGVAYAAKSCILYGSESSVKTFVSGERMPSEKKADCRPDISLPKASVSVLEPIVLETKIGDSSNDCDDPKKPPKRDIFITLGLFSVVELSRPVTLMVRTLEYNIPRKESCSESESPCEIFDKLKFPEEEFLPMSLENEVKEIEESDEPPYTEQS